MYLNCHLFYFLSFLNTAVDFASPEGVFALHSNQKLEQSGFNNPAFKQQRLLIIPEQQKSFLIPKKGRESFPAVPPS
jgi:hypothetical protein